MEQTKHTPGPWRSFNDAGPNMQSYSQSSGVARADGQKVELICGCFNDIDGGKERASANAKVMAAAPELLEALIALTEFAKANGYDSNLLPEMKNARAAIAKATT